MYLAVFVCFFKETERQRSLNCNLPDVWGTISHVRASLSKDWMGNAAKSATLWAFRQNGLLMPWFIVAYALCTTLADHPDTQLIVQITRLCPRCKAKVKVAAPWQMAYCLLLVIVADDLRGNKLQWLGRGTGGKIKLAKPPLFDSLCSNNTPANITWWQQCLSLCNNARWATASGRTKRRWRWIF